MWTWMNTLGTYGSTHHLQSMKYLSLSNVHFFVEKYINEKIQHIGVKGDGEYFSREFLENIR